jgi:hypothetical protein
MDKVKSIVKSVVREMYDRPYGVAYTSAVIEDGSDCRKLEEVAKDEVRKLLRLSRDTDESLDGWKRPDDYHMTICLGELPLHRKMLGDIGADVALQVTHFGMTNEAAAFKVTGYMSKNDVQHITMFFRTQPSASKEIKEWRELPEPFTVKAVIREIAAGKP